MSGGGRAFLISFLCGMLILLLYAIGDSEASGVQVVVGLFLLLLGGAGFIVLGGIGEDA